MADRLRLAGADSPPGAPVRNAGGAAGEHRRADVSTDCAPQAAFFGAGAADILATLVEQTPQTTAAELLAVRVDWR